MFLSWILSGKILGYEKRNKGSGTHRLVTSLIVDMDVCSFDARQLLDVDLQILGDVVGNLETLVAVHDHVDLHDEPGTAVVRPHRVDLPDVGGVRGG